MTIGDGNSALEISMLQKFSLDPTKTARCMESAQHKDCIGVRSAPMARRHVLTAAIFHVLSRLHGENKASRFHSTAKRSNKRTPRTAQHSTAQHRTARYGTARHSTALSLAVVATGTTARHSTAQHSTAQPSTVRHGTAQHSTVLSSCCDGNHSVAQHSTAQHSTAQHGTAWRGTAQHSSFLVP